MEGHERAEHRAVIGEVGEQRISGLVGPRISAIRSVIALPLVNDGTLGSEGRCPRGHVEENAGALSAGLKFHHHAVHLPVRQWVST